MSTWTTRGFSKGIIPFKFKVDRHFFVSSQPIDWTGKIISRDGGRCKEASYTEPGEEIGGYYHILATDIDEAIATAEENPEFTFNENPRIEVRPVKMKEEKTGFIYPGKS